MLEVGLSSMIDQSSSFLKYSQIHIHPTCTFRGFLIPNIKMDLGSLKQYSSMNYDHVMNRVLILFFNHCDKLTRFFHFHPTSQYCLSISSIDGPKYRTLTHLLYFLLCMDEDQKIMGCKDTHR